MSKRWPFSIINDAQMRNWFGEWALAGYFCWGGPLPHSPGWRCRHGSPRNATRSKELMDQMGLWFWPKMQYENRISHHKQTYIERWKCLWWKVRMKFYEILRSIVLYVFFRSWKHDDTTTGLNNIQQNHGQLGPGQVSTDICLIGKEHSYLLCFWIGRNPNDVNSCFWVVLVCPIGCSIPVDFANVQFVFPYTFCPSISRW